MIRCETHEIETMIKDDDYKIIIAVKTFGTFFAEDVFLRIIKIITKLLGASGGIELKDSNLENIDIGYICNSLYENINVDEIKKLIKDIVDNTSIQYIYDNDEKHEKSSLVYNLGNKKDFDEAFSGKLSLLYDTIKFVLEENYSDFLSRLNLSKIKERFKEGMEKIKAVQEAAKTGTINLSGAKLKE